MSQREEIISQILAERIRQFNLPGREWDVKNTPNDWCSIVSHYLFRDIRKNVAKPSKAEFEDSLIKAAAIILAALEHIKKMEETNLFAEED